VKPAIEDKGEAAKARVRAQSKDQQQNPTRTITDPASERAKSHRHTTDPPVLCLGRTFLMLNSRMVGGSVAGRPLTDCGAALPRGRLVRTPGGSRPKVKGREPVQPALQPANGGVMRKPPTTAFFTERSLAAYLAVSDRTIRNWIRRGELPVTSSAPRGGSTPPTSRTSSQGIGMRRDEARVAGQAPQPLGQGRLGR
jgi:Helix-turn-helix domain